VGSTKYLDLQTTLAALEKRWGTGIVTSARHKTEHPTLSTGFSELDLLLGGGVPYRQLTEFIGQPTSGRSTLAYKLITSAQAKAQAVVYLDGGESFDPDYAISCGVKLTDLLLVRPKHSAVLDILIDVIASQVPSLVVSNPASDVSQAQLLSAIDRLYPALTRSHGLLVILGTSPISPLASLRLHVQRRSWIKQGEDIRGYRAKVIIVKDKRGSEDKSVELQFTFPDTQP
jgi:RecA/RadA recombinase